MLLSASRVSIFPHMGKELERPFREALGLVSLAELARDTNRSRSAWEKYQFGERHVTIGAARELAAYLRSRSSAYAEAAEELEAAVQREEAK